MKLRDAKRIINEEIARSKAESFAKINKARLREIIREEVQKLLKEKILFIKVFNA